MITILIAVSLVSAILGLCLILNFALWEAKGIKVDGLIVGFVKGRWFRTPVLSFQVGDGGETRMRAERIDQLVFLLGRPRENEIAPIIYREEGARLRMRVFGYLPLILGALLMLPLVAALGFASGKMLAVVQVAYVVIFAGIIIGGLALMKFIARNY